MKGYRKALIAVNGSMDVVRHGISLAHEEKTWLTALKVIPPYEGDIDLTGIRNVGDVLGSGAASTLSEIKRIAESEGALIKTRIEHGEVDEKIIAVAAEEKCDVIIMGAQKSGFFKRLIGGNVVERVISGAPCPVLVVGA